MSNTPTSSDTTFLSATQKPMSTKERRAQKINAEKALFIRSLFLEQEPINSIEISTGNNHSILVENGALLEAPTTQHMLINPSECSDFISNSHQNGDNPVGEDGFDYDDIINRLTNFKATLPNEPTADTSQPQKPATTQVTTNQGTTKPVSDTPNPISDHSATTQTEEENDSLPLNIEYMSAKSAEVLPELIFQGQRFDFALIAGWRTFDYAFADFFYIDKLLSTSGIIIFDHADKPSIRKLCRFIISNLPYECITPSTSKRKRPFFNQLIEKQLQKFPKVTDTIKQVVRPELLDLNHASELDNPIIALRKVTDDHRTSNFHEAF